MLISRSSILLVALLSFLLLLQYRLWFQPGGIKEMHRLKKTLSHQAEKNEKLKKINEELLFQIKRLQNSDDAVESRARNELGMVKRDETFYQVV